MTYRLLAASALALASVPLAAASTGTFSTARLWHAARRCGSVPPGGAHRSVYVRFGG